MRCFYCMEEYDEDLDVICPYCGNDVVAPTNDNTCLPAGTVIQQRYLLGRVLGDGGFGITYIGYDKALKRRVAVKEFFPNECVTRQSGDPNVIPLSGERGERYSKGLKSFQEEAQRLANLGSVEGVVNVYDVFAENGTAYIVMEYLSGDTVAQMVAKSKRLGFGKTMNIIVPVLRSLIKIHKAGIIHRDVSPQNIIRTKEGKIVLIDFGAATKDNFSMSKSASSVVLKQGYAPVEQYNNKLEQGSWTDVYAVAATMYYMLTGITPEYANSRIIEDNLLPLSEVREGMPPTLDGILANAMAVLPEDRTQTAQELLEQIMTLKDFQKKAVKKKSVNPEKVKTETVTAASLEQKSKWKSYTGTFPVVDGTPTEKEYRSKIVTIESPVEKIPERNVEPKEIPTAQENKKSPTVKIVAAVVLFAMLTALVGVIYFDKKNNITIPDFMGQNIDSVTSDSRYNFDFEIVNVYNPDTDLDVVIAQTPVPSSRHVKKDTHVRLTVNSLDTEVTVPVLSKMTQAVAVNTLKSLYLESEIVVVHDDGFDEGTVIRTEPANGNKVKVCSKVTLYIAENSVSVPSVIGKTYEEASDILESAGLHVGEITYDYSEDYDTGYIINQGIESGIAVEKETYVSLVISQGRPYEVTLAETVDLSTLKAPFKISVVVDGEEEAKKNFYSLMFRNTYDFDVTRMNTRGETAVEIYIDDELFQSYTFDFRNSTVVLNAEYEVSAQKSADDDTDSDTDSESTSSSSSSSTSSKGNSSKSNSSKNTSSKTTSSEVSSTAVEESVPTPTYEPEYEPTDEPEPTIESTPETTSAVVFPQMTSSDNTVTELE